MQLVDQKKKKKFDWKKRGEQLKELCDKHRKSNGDYDIIVPCSGGKDGSWDLIN